jgi:AP-4 complex subunit epsilon-1
MSQKYMREYVVRLMYCEMLGHDVSWGYIHAINMTQVLAHSCQHALWEHWRRCRELTDLHSRVATQQSKLLDKWVGYIAVASFLHRDHELLILLISSLRRVYAHALYYLSFIALSPPSASCSHHRL